RRPLVEDRSRGEEAPRRLHGRGELREGRRPRDLRPEEGEAGSDPRRHQEGRLQALDRRLSPAARFARLRARAVLAPARGLAAFIGTTLSSTATSVFARPSPDTVENQDRCAFLAS